MRHRKHHSRLSRQVGARTALLRNLAKALIEHERIETTTAKAKVLRPFVENIVTLGKKGTQHDRRNAFSKLAHKTAVDKVFKEIAPRFSSRNGGYTRIIHSRR
ncbi:50S ribosomal protein L17, partial [Candidatus Sumerlaeota bacterium]|nr:50S ribosomal protein L17 [Candidatus Sumerlaeota bacterium]